MTRQPTYEPEAVKPMREDLTRVGVRELRTPEEVDAALGQQAGTTLLVINSICGCAAGGARPGVMLALQHEVIPDHLTTVFAGMEHEAVEQARSHLRGYPPSSPCIALFENGEVVTVLERHDIQQRKPAEIARALTSVFDSRCSRPGPSVEREDFEKIVPMVAGKKRDTAALDKPQTDQLRTRVLEARARAIEAGAWLLESSTGDGDALQRTPIQPLPFRVGRTSNLELVLSSAPVSKTHAEIYSDGEALQIRDLGSRNGTFLNRQPVSDAALHRGDILHFGDAQDQTDDEVGIKALRSPAKPGAQEPALGVFGEPVGPGCDFGGQQEKDCSRKLALDCLADRL